MPDPVTITGSGTVDTPLEIPEGAQSLRVDVACSGGFVLVSAGGDVGSAIGGTCGGVYHFTLPLPDSRVAQVRISASTPPTGAPEAFAATAWFSTEPKAVDAEVTADCDDISAVDSAIANAQALSDAGDLDGWADLVATAVDELDAMTPTGLLAPQVAVLRDWLASAPQPGSLYDARPDAVNDADSIIGQLCSDNGSIISVTPGGDPATATK